MPAPVRGTNLARAARLEKLQTRLLIHGRNSRPSPKRTTTTTTACGATNETMMMIYFAISTDNVVLLCKHLDALPSSSWASAWTDVVLRNHASIRCASYLASRRLISREDLACVAASSSRLELLEDLCEEEPRIITPKLFKHAMSFGDVDVVEWVFERASPEERAAFDVRGCMRRAIEKRLVDHVGLLLNRGSSYFERREMLDLAISLRDLELTLTIVADRGVDAIRRALQVTKGLDGLPDRPWIRSLHRCLGYPRVPGIRDSLNAGVMCAC
jgi:hypothetical protein